MNCEFEDGVCVRCYYAERRPGQVRNCDGETPEVRVPVGSMLKARIGSLGLTPKSGCKCNARARQMDEWGYEGCVERRDEIVAWLVEQAGRIPFASLACGFLVDSVLRKARIVHEKRTRKKKPPQA